MNDLILKQDKSNLFEFSTLYVQTKACPIEYREKPDEFMVAYLTAEQLGLNPLLGISRIAMINGKSCLYGEAFLGIIQAHPTYAGIKIDITEEYAKVTITRHLPNFNKFQIITAEFSMLDATAAGLFTNKTWKSYPKDMMYYKALHRAAKRSFADVLMGVEIKELYEAEAPTKKSQAQSNNDIYENWGNNPPSIGVLSSNGDLQTMNNRILIDDPISGDQISLDIVEENRKSLNERILIDDPLHIDPSLDMVEENRRIQQGAQEAQEAFKKTIEAFKNENESNKAV